MKNLYELLAEFENPNKINERKPNKLYDELVEIGKQIDKQISSLKKFVRKTKNQKAIKEVNDAIKKLDEAFLRVEEAEYQIDMEQEQ